MDEINTGSLNIIDSRSQSISQRVQNGVAFANFQAHEFSYLNITSIRTHYVVGGEECGFACAEIPSCFSYNLAASNDSNGRILCELLPSDKYNNSDKFISSHLFHHFSIGVSPEWHVCKSSLTISLKCFSLIVFSVLNMSHSVD